MEKLKDAINEHPLYTEFSVSNEKYLSEITESLKDIIDDLNSRNSVNDEILNKLSETIDISNAVFRSLSSSEGLELVLRLKAISSLYKKNLSENSNLTSIAGHILKKLDMFNSTFYHQGSSDEIHKAELPYTEISLSVDAAVDLFYKWITFERNGSLFIAQYRSLIIKEFVHTAAVEPVEQLKDYEADGIRFQIIDLMKSPDREAKVPSKLLLINNRYCYAADYTGRELHGSYDMISPIIEPLDAAGIYFSGRVRLFGRRYLVIRQS